MSLEEREAKEDMKKIEEESVKIGLTREDALCLLK